MIQGILRDRDGLLARIFDGAGVGRIVMQLLALNFVLLAAYGTLMGLAGENPQWLYSAIKLPLLYLLSLAVCLPVLYIVNALVGSRLGLLQTLALILVALGLNALIVIACAPITLFFFATGSDYNFMKLLHFAIFAFSGLWAMGALYRGLFAACENSSIYPRHALRIMLLWIVVYSFVGTQMTWTLRPFIGSPDLPVEWIRQHRPGEPGNIYQALLRSLAKL